MCCFSLVLYGEYNPSSSLLEYILQHFYHPLKFGILMGLLELCSIKSTRKHATNLTNENQLPTFRIKNPYKDEEQHNVTWRKAHHLGVPKSNLQQLNLAFLLIQDPPGRRIEFQLDCNMEIR